MHIGQDGHAICASYRLQHAQAFINAKATFTGKRGAVGFVIAGLEDILRADGRAGFFHPARDHLRVIFGFELARAGNDRQGTVVADDNVTDCDLGHEVTCSLRIAAVRDNMR